MLIRMLAIDLDGTLLDSNRQIPKRHRESIGRALGQGWIVVLASGRSVAGVKPFADELGLDGPFLCANGAHVVLTGGRELLHVPLGAKALRTVHEYARREGLHMNVYAREHLYFARETAWGAEYLRRALHLVPVAIPHGGLGGLEATKAMLVGDADEMEQHQSALRRRLSNGQAAIVRSEPEYLEFLAPSVNKGWALARLASALGVARSEVASIGDSYNDVEMLRWSAVSAVVSSAAKPIRDAGYRVMPSNDEAGVADFVDALIADKEQ